MSHDVWSCLFTLENIATQKIGAFWRRRRQRSPESSQHLAIWATKTSFESNMGTPMAQHIVKTKWKSSPQGPTWVQYEICWDILELDDLATAENTALGQTFFLQRLARCGLLCRFPGPCCFKHLLTAELSSLGCCLKYEGSWTCLVFVFWSMFWIRQLRLCRICIYIYK